jgi:hypothetical protein
VAAVISSVLSGERRAARCIGQESEAKENEGDGCDLSANKEMGRSDDCGNDGPFCLHYVHRLAARLWSAKQTSVLRVDSVYLIKGWGGGFPATIVRGDDESASIVHTKTVASPNN